MTTTQSPQTYGYVNLHRLRANVNEAIEHGLIRYDRGFRRSMAGMESSKPEEMLEAARALGADVALVTRIRALIAADRICWDREKVGETIDALALSSGERQIVAQVLMNYARGSVQPAKVYSLPRMKPVAELLSK